MAGTLPPAPLAKNSPSSSTRSPRPLRPHPAPFVVGPATPSAKQGPILDELKSPRFDYVPRSPPMTPDRKQYDQVAPGDKINPTAESSVAGAAKRSGGLGDRTAPWAGTGGAGAGGRTSNGTDHPQHQGGGNRHRPHDSAGAARLSSSTSARPSAGYASSSSSAPTGRTSIRNSSGVPYNSHRRASSPIPRGPRLFPLAQSTTGPLASADANGASQFLLTVVPPMHLPHDPPHPRTSQACSGYGPPEYFRRGTLIPLYPTLSSQLAAVAREYGLPSTGGLVLYLLSTSDPSSSTQAALPGSAGLAGEGGPRIGEEAWRLLWGRLFQAEEEEILIGENGSMTDEDEYAPPVPPIPLSHLGSLSHLHNLHDDGVQAGDVRFNPSLPDTRRFASDSDAELEQHTSFSSDADGGESVYSAVGAENGESNTTASNKSRHGSGASTGPPSERRPSSSSRAGGSIGHGLPPIYTGLPSPSSRDASSQSRSRGLASFSSQPNLRQSSRQSILSNSRSTASRGFQNLYPSSSRSTSFGGSYSAQPLGGAGYGSSVIVGKVEFDIDWRRGGRSRWYEGWVEGAAPAPLSASLSASTSGGRSPSQGYSTSSGPPTSDFIDEATIVRSFPRVPTAESSVDGFSPGLSPSEPNFPDHGQDATPMPTPRRDVTDGIYSPSSSRHQLHLPQLVDQRRMQEEADFVPETQREEDEPESQELDNLAPNGFAPPLAPSSPPQMRIRTASGRSRVAESAASGYSIAAFASQAGDDDDEQEDEGLNSSRTTRSPSPGLPPSESLSSIKIHAAAESDEDDAQSSEASIPSTTNEEEDPALGYAPLHDGEDGPHETDATESDYEEEEPATVEEPEGERLPSPTLNLPHLDPLEDIFGGDEATWASMAAELNGMRSPSRERPPTIEHDPVDLTGLGSFGPRVEELAFTAPAGVVERTSLNEEGVFAPQDDVEEVMTMLKSGQAESKTDAVNLASPIHLDPVGPAETGVFPSNDLPPAVEPDYEDPRVLPRLEEVPPRRRNRHGGSDWASSPTFDPTQTFSVNLEKTLQDAHRDSNLGLMENLEQLERALSDLSPKTGKTARRELAPSPSAASEASSAAARSPSSPSTYPPFPLSLENAQETLVSPQEPVPASAVPARIDSRPVAYDDLIGTPSPTSPAFTESAYSSIIERRPSLPNRQLSLTSDMPGYGRESLEESAAPPTPAENVGLSAEQARPQPSPLGAPPSDPLPQAPATPRTPRTSSLKSEGRTPRSVALPSSPMPPPDVVNPVQEAPDAPEPPAPAFPPLTRAVGPTGLGIDFPFSPPSDPIPLEAPPLPKRPSPPPLELASSTGSSSSQPPPQRSPNLRSLRPTKPWKTDAPPSKSPELATGEKSPKGAFFQKPAFKLFAKKSTTTSSPTFSAPTFSAPPVDSAPIPPALPARPPQTPTVPSPIPGSDLTNPREAPLPPPPTATPSPFAVPSSPAPNQTPDTTAPPSPETPQSTSTLTSLGPASSEHDLRPTPSTESFRTASPGREPLDDERPSTPLPQLPPPPPISPDRNIIITSPRSEYAAPDTPVAGGQPRYPASAPTTPANWSRASASRSRPKPKISSDIDDLLSQMNDFGGDEEEVVAPVKVVEVKPPSPQEDAGTALGNSFLLAMTGPPSPDLPLSSNPSFPQT